MQKDNHRRVRLMYMWIFKKANTGSFNNKAEVYIYRTLNTTCTTRVSLFMCPPCQLLYMVRLDIVYKWQLFKTKRYLCSVCYKLAKQTTICTYLRRWYSCPAPREIGLYGLLLPFVCLCCVYWPPFLIPPNQSRRASLYGPLALCSWFGSVAARWLGERHESARRSCLRRLAPGFSVCFLVIEAS